MSSKDAFWFPHDCNAADDDKTMLLIDQLGLEGYGIYWVLIEKLREREGFVMPFTSIPILARRYLTTTEKVKAVVMNYGLFEYDENGFFFSNSLNNRMQKWIDKKEKAAIAGRASAQKRLNARSTHAQQTLNVCSTDVQQTFNECSTTVQLEEKRIEQNITEEYNTIVETEVSTTDKTESKTSFCNNIMDAYNMICTNLPKVMRLNDRRKAKIIKRDKDIGGVDKWIELFEIIQNSAFLCGDNSNGWKASFDWIIENDTNYVKVLEGNYNKQSYGKKNELGTNHGGATGTGSQEVYTEFKVYTSEELERIGFGAPTNKSAEKYTTF